MTKSNSSIRVKTLFYLILFSVFILLLLWGTQLILSNYLYEKYQMNDMSKLSSKSQNEDKSENMKNIYRIAFDTFDVLISFIMFGSLLSVLC